MQSIELVIEPMNCEMLSTLHLTLENLDCKKQGILGQLPLNIKQEEVLL
jgi:hypothetical protein